MNRQSNGGHQSTGLRTTAPPQVHSVSPKQPSSKRKRDWYPYYAGFPEAFSHAVLATHLKHARVVLDPWSGSGTTTATCFKKGLPSMGVDINPAMTVVSRARLLPVSARNRLRSLARKILETARDNKPGLPRNDLLAQWIQPAAAQRIRSIQAAVHKTIAPYHSIPTPQSICVTSDTLPAAACFFYCILFSVVRRCLARFRTTNPMWYTPPSTYRHRIHPSWTSIYEAFQASLRILLGRLSITRGPSPPGIRPLRTGTATNLPFPTDYFDAVLTSPPYATRLDYVRGTLPELALLGANDGFIASLRRQTTGSPVVRGVRRRQEIPLLSSCAHQSLRHIAAHGSKGSRTYYYPWMRNYLLGLQAGLAEIHRTVIPHGVVCLVIQDSFYKDYRLDLQRMVVEMMAAFGRLLVSRHDHATNHPRLRSRPDVSDPSSSNRDATETLLVFTQP